MRGMTPSTFLRLPAFPASYARVVTASVVATSNMWRCTTSHRRVWSTRRNGSRRAGRPRCPSMFATRSPTGCALSAETTCARRSWLSRGQPWRTHACVSRESAIADIGRDLSAPRLGDHRAHRRCKRTSQRNAQLKFFAAGSCGLEHCLPNGDAKKKSIYGCCDSCCRLGGGRDLAACRTIFVRPCCGGTSRDARSCHERVRETLRDVW